MTHPHCHGVHCTADTGELRLVRLGGLYATPLCQSCFAWLMDWRRARNSELKESAYGIEEWLTAEVYAVPVTELAAIPPGPAVPSWPDQAVRVVENMGVPVSLLPGPELPHLLEHVGIQSDHGLPAACPA
jgi:hypothetical protein